MYQRILVPVDGSPLSMGGLDAAIGLAKLTGGALGLIHVTDEQTFALAGESAGGDVLDIVKAEGERILEDGKAHAEAQGVPVSTRLVESLGVSVAEAVIEHARGWQADLIVLGTHGRRGVVRLLLGSDAEQIARTAPVPVLLTRQEVTQLSFRIAKSGSGGAAPPR